MGIAPYWQERFHKVFCNYTSEENDYEERELNDLIEEYTNTMPMTTAGESRFTYAEQDQLQKWLFGWYGDQMAYLELTEFIMAYANRDHGKDTDGQETQSITEA